jgi:AcrR family transcriptional regulator
MRADAERNRAAVLEAAREMFAEQGLEAPLEEIARRAGVGIGTLYRRFPSRDRLVAAALVDKVAGYADAASEALGDPDPWAGFVGFVERACAMQAEDRGLGDLLSMSLTSDPQIVSLRTDANERVIRLVDRAKAAGRLRADFVGEDLLFIMIAAAEIAHVTARDAPEAWRRFVALAVEALQAPGSSALPAPPTTEQMVRAMGRLAAERARGPSG